MIPTCNLKPACNLKPTGNLIPTCNMKPTKEWTFIENDGKTSNIIYYENAFTGHEQRMLLDNFMTMHDFIGSDHVTRTQKWYDIERRYFCDAWKNRYARWRSFEYPAALMDLQAQMQEFITNNLGTKMHLPIINSCLINKYTNGDDFIAPHRDTPASFGDAPTIVNVSFGATRKIVFKRIHQDLKPDKHNADKNFEITLKSGSIMIMGGETQKYFSHEIPKDDTTQCRISCTFREKLY